MFEIRPYSLADDAVWESMCAQAGNASFLHTRRFLTYHKNRFQDASVLVFEDRQCLGILPAALDVSRPEVVCSHPGATYGGLVHAGRLGGGRMIEALAAIGRHYAGLGYQHLVYKAVPSIHQLQPSQDDLYALFRLGARRVRSDLSSTIDFAARRPLNERRRRALKKTVGAQVSSDWARLPEFYGVLSAVLKNRHGAHPVHSLEELDQLHRLFPNEIQLRTVMSADKVDAGVIFFNSRSAWHCQYIASSDIGQKANALDLLFDLAIRDATSAGVRYFDFGTSNEDQGRVLNEGLYSFKSEFGGGGIVHEFYELDLTR